MYLIFDTETTGLPKNWNAPITDTDNWPRCVQIAWQLHDNMGVLVDHQDYLIRPDGFNIPYDAEQVHGISTELALQQGEELETVLKRFNEALSKATHLVGQNLGFDLNIMGCEYLPDGHRDGPGRETGFGHMYGKDGGDLQNSGWEIREIQAPYPDGIAPGALRGDF